MNAMKLNDANAILCVWPATIVGENNRDEFESWLRDEFKARGEYVCEFETLPDVENGREVEGTGGRNDVLFWIANECIPTFAVARLAYGIRWWEDYAAHSRAIIPKETLDEFSKLFVHEYDVRGDMDERGVNS